MPTSSSATAVEQKKQTFRLKTPIKSIDQHDTTTTNNTRSDNFLTIEPALPLNDRRRLYKRSHSTLNVSTSINGGDGDKSRRQHCDPVALRSNTATEGVYVSRSQAEKDTTPDRICLDRRGLTGVPAIHDELKLRLLSLQHNLIVNLDGLHGQRFPFLVFLDIYDNQLDRISGLDGLDNLRVLLVGKNRLRKIEGLQRLKKIEVLDLHGNQINQVTGLYGLSDLKVLNLAGNQIRSIGTSDLHGLHSLQELNLRRNRLRKLLGFNETPGLVKIFLSNNDLQSVEDISSLAKSSNLREIAIDNNPVSMGGDCVSFLVSYLPQLVRLNTMQITEQVRKAAMAWRRNKESTNAAFMDLTSDVLLNVRREEVISNARTNWELLRSQTKCLGGRSTTSIVGKSFKNDRLKPDHDFILTSLTANKSSSAKSAFNKKSTKSISTVKVPKLVRSISQDTENSLNTTMTTSSSTTSSTEFFRLPPILVPIINKIEQSKIDDDDNNYYYQHPLRLSGSLSSIGPNINSSVSSLGSGDDDDDTSSSSDSESSSDVEVLDEESSQGAIDGEKVATSSSTSVVGIERIENQKNKNTSCSDSSSSINSNITNNLSSSSNANRPAAVVLSHPVGSDNNNKRVNQKSSEKIVRTIKSAAISNGGRILNSKLNIANHRAATATKGGKKQQGMSPAAVGGAALATVAAVAPTVVVKDREQGGDYLIEICGRYLNVYGQCALRFIDKPWNASKANDVNTVKFNYVNFNSIVSSFHKLKIRFPHADHFVFKETNITVLGQLNALAELQGLTSLYIDADGNAIAQKLWESYAIYRLSHWGLRVINDREITDDDIRLANEEYQKLSDLVLWSLPEQLLQPLLVRLRLDHGLKENNVKRWLLSADPALKSVVSKEALQWKKGAVSAAQEDMVIRQKAKQHITLLLEEMSNAVSKLRLLDDEWPGILHEIVQNALLDYSQLDMYMKQKINELNK